MTYFLTTWELILSYILTRTNKMQQYAGIYLLQNYSKYFECPSHPSSGVHKTVTATSGTGHITYLCNNLPPRWPLGHLGIINIGNAPFLGQTGCIYCKC